MQSVRGFAENELGPAVLQARRSSLLAAGCTDASIADGSCNPANVPSSALFTRPTGGSTLLEGSAELRIPLGRLIGGVAFVDGAYVGTSGLDSPAHARGAVTPGAGLRYRSPLGVLRLDIGLRPVGERSLRSSSPYRTARAADTVVRLTNEKSYSPIDPSPGALHSLARRLVVHFAMGQAFDGAAQSPTRARPGATRPTRDRARYAAPTCAARDRRAGRRCRFSSASSSSRARCARRPGRRCGTRACPARRTAPPPGPAAPPRKPSVPRRRAASGRSFAAVGAVILAPSVSSTGASLLTEDTTAARSVSTPRRTTGSRRARC